MCYSAEIWTDPRDYENRFPGAQANLPGFVDLYKRRQDDPKLKIPRGIDLAFLNPKTVEEKQIRSLIDEHNTAQVTSSEQELFKQVKRLADAERKLAVKETKAALNDQRIAGNKIKQMKRWIADAKRTEHDPQRDDRIFPDWYAPVLIVENGKLIVQPMRYHCRPAGMDPAFDRTKSGQVSGTYNARRDNLKRFWRNQYGHTHGLMLAEKFYENVDDGKGGSHELQFVPRTGETMLIACLWSHWTDPEGVEPDLYSFAAITDDPEPEVAAAGHDRTIINIRPEHVDAWLHPDAKDLDAMSAILDDKRHPFYEHRKAA